MIPLLRLSYSRSAARSLFLLRSPQEVVTCRVHMASAPAHGHRNGGQAWKAWELASRIYYARIFVSVASSTRFLHLFNTAYQSPTWLNDFFFLKFLFILFCSKKRQFFHKHPLANIANIVHTKSRWRGRCAPWKKIVSPGLLRWRASSGASSLPRTARILEIFLVSRKSTRIHAVRDVIILSVMSSVRIDFVCGIHDVVHPLANRLLFCGCKPTICC